MYPSDGTLPRCPHGVYNSTTHGEPTKYCSGCAVPEPGLVVTFQYPPVNLDDFLQRD